MLKAYIFSFLSKDATPLPIETGDDSQALNILNELVKDGSIQGFLMLLKQKKESENE